MTSNKPRALATKAPTSATKASASASHPYAGATTRSRAAQTRNNQGAPTIHNVIGATANKPQQELFQLEVLLTHKPGETLTIACRDNDSMKVVLENIRTQLGIQPDDVVVDNLYINGNNLRVFGGTVGYYRIFGRVFTYHPVLKQKRAIHVRLDNGEVLVLEPPSLDGTLGTLAKMISDMEGIPVQEQKFTLMGLPLVTYEQTLKGHGIEWGSTISMTQWRGSDSIKPSFESLVGLPGTHEGDLVFISPSGPFLSRGAYIQSRCACSPTKPIFYHKGREIFDLERNSYHLCPECRRYDIAPITNVGFVECKYRIIAIRKDNGLQFTSAWKQTEGNQYRVLDIGMKVKWRKVIIETAELGRKEVCFVCLKKCHNDGGGGEVRKTGTRRCGHSIHEECLRKCKGHRCPGCYMNKFLDKVPIPEDV